MRAASMQQSIVGPRLQRYIRHTAARAASIALSRGPWGPRRAGRPAKRLAPRSAPAAAGAQPAPDPGPNPAPKPGEGPRGSDGGGWGAASPPSAGSRQLWLRALGQVALLAVALAGLILLPAQLSGRLGAEPARAAAAYATYIGFFSTGTLLRVLRHGGLAPRRRDAQLASGGSRRAFALFLLAVPLGHLLAWLDPSLYLLPGGAGAGDPDSVRAWALHGLLTAAGYGLMVAGWALNAAAAAALGKAYDRLVTPDHLVTAGPYLLVQHPIYTSYMLLFCGHCLSLGSPLAAAFLWAACLAYYSSRTAIEARLLEAEFGEQYQQYHSSTGRFVPRSWGSLPLGGWQQRPR